MRKDKKNWMGWEGGMRKKWIPKGNYKKDIPAVQVMNTKLS